MPKSESTSGSVCIKTKLKRKYNKFTKMINLVQCAKMMSEKFSLTSNRSKYCLNEHWPDWSYSLDQV